MLTQTVKKLPAMQETGVQYMGQEKPMEKGMATHSTKYSCLEKFMDRGTWRATIPKIANSWTQLGD